MHEIVFFIEDAFICHNAGAIFFLIVQKPDNSGLVEFLKPLNDAIVKATRMTEGRPDFFNHLKSAADSLSALAWIAYTGKDCG